jgi:bifunctional non-homologous end joining protein LigD
MIARRERNRLRIFTRRGHDWTERVPRIAAALAALPIRSATLDGECVVTRPDGVTDFDALRTSLSRRIAPTAFLYAFDVMELDGRDLRRAALDTRRAVLEYLVGWGGSPGICAQ